MSFGIRLRELRTKKRMTQQELGDIVHVSKVSISGYEKGKRSPDTDTLQALANYFNVTTDYLLGRTEKLDTVEFLPISSSNFSIPIFGSIVASNPEGAKQDIEGKVEIQSDVIEKYGENNLLALRVNGDSMNKVIPDGAIAILLKTDDVSQGDICGVIINGYEATLKHVYKTPNRILFEPDSYNPKHKPFEYTEDMDVEVTIIGKYLYAILGR